MKTGKSVLIVGASGLVGGCLLERFADEAEGTYHRNPRPGLHRLDMTDAGRARALITELRPRVIIHAAALTAVDHCEVEPEASRAVNVEGTRNVAEAAAAVGARYLFFSTDYVFGGEHGPHRLGDPFEPLNVYGAHKLEAERLVAEAVADHVIVRACNLYGYQPDGKNFVMAVYAAGVEGRRLRVPLDQWGSPTLAEDLAAAIEVVVRSDVRGAVHLAGPDYLERLSLARRAAAAFALDDGFIEGVPTADLGQAAPRPREGGLDAAETTRRLGVRFTGLDEGLTRMRRAMVRAGLAVG